MRSAPGHGCDRGLSLTSCIRHSSQIGTILAGIFQGHCFQCRQKTHARKIPNDPHIIAVIKSG